ncbi:bacterio-opsin activator domain-containing protein [Natronorubrum halophilum]|uniref:bacterio-opsin activator domain-containing protein n=1 Tax=Natronorubrum halophilum TaxID=1702106 RepID=UPI000EF6BB75|nr:bacterio-opsin activator domain-containing protein [Natronorubrum halophilum]
MSEESATVVGDVLRILVVGDSESIETAMDALSSQFESVSLVRERTLSNAVERLAHLDIHCVVCSFETVANGPSTIDRLRGRSENLPIVAVSDEASIDSAAIETVLEAGATDVIESDTPRSLIAARVRNAAERFRLESAADRRKRSILERSDALVWVVDDEGSIEYASSTAEARMDYTPDELERTSLPKLVHQDDREAVRGTLETVSAAALGATERVSVRIGHGDGTWRAYELTATNRLADPLVDGIVLTLSTATAADSTAGIRAALDRLEDPIFSLGPRWELRYANEAANRLFVSETTAEPGTVVWDLLDDTVRSQFYERLLEAEATGTVVEFETDPSTLETRLVVSAHPGDAGVTVYARDAADGEPAAVDQDRFELLESVVDALEDGVAVLEGSTITVANAALFELVDGATLIGRAIDAVFDDELAAAIRERSRSPVVRWMEPVSGQLTLGESRRAVDVLVTPLPGDDRTLCVVRDGRRSSAAALSAIDRTVAAMREAEGRPAVRQSAVDAILACSGADLVGWYLVEADVLRPAAVATAAANDSIDLPPIDRARTDLVERLEADADATGSGVVFDRSELGPALTRSGIRADRVLAVPVAGHGILLATSTDPMAFEALDRTPLEIIAGATATALDAFERESTMRTYRNDLERLESVAARCRHLRDVERTLLAGETRAEIHQDLCEALVSLETDDLPSPVELAWVGGVATGAERIAPDAWAGRDEDALESAAIPMEIDSESDHPATRAAGSLESAVVDDLESGDLGGTEPEWRRRALESGFRSVLSVPLVADEFCYGTLTVYATRPSAFDDAARRLCEHLATVASHAIVAIERKRALVSDRLTELEVVLRDDDEPLSSIAHRLDRPLEVQAVVPRSSGGSTVFCTVPERSEETIHAAIESLSAVESGRIVGERANESAVEFVLAESAVTETLADHGGVLRSITPVDDRTRLVVDLSSTVDVRSFLRMLERTYPGAELAARREHDRSARPAGAFDAELRRRLSEQQLRTLETAHYAGFFEWPRESTGEDVADSLGVSQPTFSRHLRLAQQKLFALLFDERDAGEE